jgi:hypothetical protein
MSAQKVQLSIGIESDGSFMGPSERFRKFVNELTSHDELIEYLRIIKQVREIVISIIDASQDTLVCIEPTFSHDIFDCGVSGDGAIRVSSVMVDTVRKHKDRLIEILDGHHDVTMEAMDFDFSVLCEDYTIHLGESENELEHVVLELTPETRTFFLKFCSSKQMIPTLVESVLDILAAEYILTLSRQYPTMIDEEGRCKDLEGARDYLAMLEHNECWWEYWALVTNCGLGQKNTIYYLGEIDVERNNGAVALSRDAAGMLISSLRNKISSTCDDMTRDVLSPADDMITRLDANSEDLIPVGDKLVCREELLQHLKKFCAIPWSITHAMLKTVLNGMTDNEVSIVLDEVQIHTLFNDIELVIAPLQQDIGLVPKVFPVLNMDVGGVATYKFLESMVDRGWLPDDDLMTHSCGPHLPGLPFEDLLGLVLYQSQHI